MVRTLSPAKLDRIVDAALDAFLASGYRNTRMDAIAGSAEVSAGTLYLYATGKDGLFRLALMRAFHVPLPAVAELPFGAAVDTDTVDWLWSPLRASSPFTALRAAAARRHPDDHELEFRDVIEELWAWQSRFWRAIRLIEKCAGEWPELELLFYLDFRRELLGLGAQYLARRMLQGYIQPYPDPDTAARVLVENVAFFAMHGHGARDSADLSEDASHATVLKVLERAFVVSPSRSPK